MPKLEIPFGNDNDLTPVFWLYAALLGYSLLSLLPDLDAVPTLLLMAAFIYLCAEANKRKKKTPLTDWRHSHYQWMLRTLAISSLVLALALVVFGVNFILNFDMAQGLASPVLASTLAITTITNAVINVYAIVRLLLKGRLALQRRPVPNPKSLLV